MTTDTGERGANCKYYYVSEQEKTLPKPPTSNSFVYYMHIWWRHIAWVQENCASSADGCSYHKLFKFSLLTHYLCLLTAWIYFYSYSYLYSLCCSEWHAVSKYLHIIHSIIYDICIMYDACICISFCQICNASTIVGFFPVLHPHLNLFLQLHTHHGRKMN